jgi:glutamate/tyrosine decarboxylase-like PLP-dependent enzyme
MFSLGPQFSRGFHALKIWVSLLAHGWHAYERRIAHDAALARYLHARAAAHEELESVGSTPALSIACFRYVPPELRDRPESVGYVNRLNELLMTALQHGGRVFPSNAVLNGQFVLRACIVNFRTEARDIDALIAESVQRGRELHTKANGAVELLTA